MFKCVKEFHYLVSLNLNFYGKEDYSDSKKSCSKEKGAS